MLCVPILAAFGPTFALVVAIDGRARTAAFLEPAQEFGELCSSRRKAASPRRGWHQPREGSRPRLAGAVAELSFESPAETRGICKAEVLGNCRDRLVRHWVGQDRMRFEQPLELNVSGHAACIFEQPIEIGTGDSDEPAEVLRP